MTQSQSIRWMTFLLFNRVVYELNKSSNEPYANCIFNDNLVNIFDTAYFKIIIKIGIAVDIEGLEVMNRICLSYINLCLNASRLSQYFNETARNNVKKPKTDKF